MTIVCIAEASIAPSGHAAAVQAAAVQAAADAAVHAAADANADVHVAADAAAADGTMSAWHCAVPSVGASAEPRLTGVFRFFSLHRPDPGLLPEPIPFPV